MKVLAIGDSHSAHFKIAVENAATFGFEFFRVGIR